VKHSKVESSLVSPADRTKRAVSTAIHDEDLSKKVEQDSGNNLLNILPNYIQFRTIRTIYMYVHVYFKAEHSGFIRHTSHFFYKIDVIVLWWRHINSMTWPANSLDLSSLLIPSLLKGVVHQSNLCDYVLPFYEIYCPLLINYPPLKGNKVWPDITWCKVQLNGTQRNSVFFVVSLFIIHILRLGQYFIWCQSGTNSGKTMAQQQSRKIMTFLYIFIITFYAYLKSE